MELKGQDAETRGAGSSHLPADSLSIEVEHQLLLLPLLVPHVHLLAFLHVRELDLDLGRLAQSKEAL